MSKKSWSGTGITPGKNYFKEKISGNGTIIKHNPMFTKKPSSKRVQAKLKELRA
jgi:hypothetical protein